MLVDEDGSIWFRQSWLDTANRCGERGRLAAVMPEWNEATNDAALIGTATHTAIQAALEGRAEDAAICGDIAYTQALLLCEDEDVKWTKWTLPGQLGEHARRCAMAWFREIRPQIEPGGQCEVEFKVPLGERDGRVYGITGTVDYIEPGGDTDDGHIVDWKTASRKFYQREKQRTAIQPTVYAAAAVRGAFDGPAFTYPVTFRYGVMVRGNEKATTQVLDVQRSRAHEQWLMDQIETYIDMADALGVKRHWPRNEDHYLCNETWCPWWSVCKGARLSTAQDTWTA